jgi:hypothetical protein
MLGTLGKYLASQTSKQAAVSALPGAGVNFLLGTLTGGPVAGAAYAAGDFLLNYPLVGLARKIAPGTPGGVANIVTKEGKRITKEIPYAPSALEGGVNFAASLASAPLVDMVTKGALYPQNQVVEPTQISQEQQIYQQAKQRQDLNQLSTQALSPGTQFQMQGIEHTFHYPGITLPPEMLEMIRIAE